MTKQTINYDECYVDPKQDPAMSWFAEACSMDAQFVEDAITETDFTNAVIALINSGLSYRDAVIDAVRYFYHPQHLSAYELKKFEAAINPPAATEVVSERDEDVLFVKRTNGGAK